MTGTPAKTRNRTTSESVRLGFFDAGTPLIPTEEAWSWQMAARCRGEDTSMFFHPDGERGRAAERRQEKAKAICAECAVAAECREYALKYQEPFGIWGGLSEHERMILLGRHRARRTQCESIDALRSSRSIGPR